MKQVLMLVAVLTLLASIAVAQDIETTMAGRAQIGAGLLSEAWLENPAVLGLHGLADGTADGGWVNSVAGLYELDGEADLRSVSWGGHPAGMRYGIGAGWTEVADMDAAGLGIGWGSKDGRLAAGLNYQSVDVEGLDSLDVFDVAIGGLLPDVCAAFDTGIWSIVARDITDEMTTTYDAGIGFQSDVWRVAADLEDFTDEHETIFQIGASRRFGAMNQFQAGAGLDDGDLTAGVVYHDSASDGAVNWKVGLAWLDGDDSGDDAWVIGAGADWGP